MIYANNTSITGGANTSYRVNIQDNPTDTFFREGAAFGVLFQAHNSAVLASQIAAQRKTTPRSAAGGCC